MMQHNCANRKDALFSAAASPTAQFIKRVFFICRPLKRIIAVCLVLEGSLFPATIKTKDGQILKGEIEGIIVLKKEEQLAPSAEKPVMRYLTTYHVLNGKEIERIDEQGVHVKINSSIVILMASQENSPLEDWIVFDGALKREGPAASQWRGRHKDTGQEYILVRRGGRATKPMTLNDTLVGKMGRDQQAAKDIIVQHLEIKIKNILVKVPVADLTPFQRSP
jgi:hypothetical protein